MLSQVFSSTSDVPVRAELSCLGRKAGIKKTTEIKVHSNFKGSIIIVDRKGLKGLSRLTAQAEKTTYIRSVSHDYELFLEGEDLETLMAQKQTVDLADAKITGTLSVFDDGNYEITCFGALGVH